MSAHHYEGGELLKAWLEEMRIELMYLPTYSPELCFDDDDDDDDDDAFYYSVSEYRPQIKRLNPPLSLAICSF